MESTSSATDLRCAACESPITTRDRYCNSCGTAVVSCPGCGTALSLEAQSCTRCGWAAGSEGKGPAPTPGGAPADGSGWTAILERLRGATAGEFQVMHPIGRGGMAAVFLAHELALDRRVAIKVMAPALLLADGMLERFRNEAVAVANMTHPNIVTIHAVRQVGELHFFVMQFVEGRPLDYIVQQFGPLSVDLVRSISYQVGSALAYAHRRGVIHRDVKPANLLIDREGNAIVTDFGIAKLAEVSGYTQAGVAIGTPTYMSPEQFEGAEVTWTSDQYALGVVIYELLTGAPPFRGSAATIMQGHVQKPVPPIRAVRADCPPELERVVVRMLSKNPADRWPSMAEALRALGAFLPDEGDPVRAKLAHLAAPDPLLATRIASVPSPLPVRMAEHSEPRREELLPEELAVVEPPAAVPEREVDVSVPFTPVPVEAAEEDTASSVPSGEQETIDPAPARSAAIDIRSARPQVGHRRPRRARTGAWPVAVAGVIAVLLVLLFLGRTARSPEPDPSVPRPPAVALAPTDGPQAPMDGQTEAGETPGSVIQPSESEAQPGQLTPGDLPGSSPAAPAAEAPVATSPAGAAAAALRSEARPLLDSFVRSLATGNASNVRRVYPGMRGTEPWWRFANHRAGSGLRVSYFELEEGGPRLTGNAAAEVGFEVTFNYTEGAENARQYFMFRALLAFENNRWRIRELRHY